MSNIVALDRKPRQRRDASEQGPFQLLFFTGVRYERTERAAPLATARKRRRPARVKDADKRSA